MNDMTKILQELNHQKAVLEEELSMVEESLLTPDMDREGWAYYQGKAAGLRYSVRFLNYRIEDLTRKGGF